MLRYLTAGESHGPQLTAVIEGMPSGIPIDVHAINTDLRRRQQGYGRGDRMKIETDTVEIVSGVRWGETIGSPVTLVVKNRDWENWQSKMSTDAADRDEAIAVTRVRPGHADLSGALKYNHRDARNVLERSSARETAVRVAVGACAKAFLAQFGICVNAFVVSIGGVNASRPDLPIDELVGMAAASSLFTYDSQVEARMKEVIDHAKASGDSVGGVIEISATGVPVGLGSYVQWDRKLDARLAMALMSIQAIKGVEVGAGFRTAGAYGSKVHDPVCFDPHHHRSPLNGGFYRTTNNAGGIEGGMSNGEEILLRCAMKPIPTLYSPLKTVDMLSKAPIEATVERSDVCAVPAASVVAEAVVSFELAQAFIEKFGGDSLDEIRRSYDGYLEYLRSY